MTTVQIRAELATLNHELQDAQTRLHSIEPDGRPLLQREIRMIKRDIVRYTATSGAVKSENGT